MRLRILAARHARGLYLFHPLRKQRAQGRPDARCTRGLVCISHNKMRTRAYRSSGEHPAFPAQWFYGLYVVFLVRRALLPPSPARTALTNLTPAFGRRNHTTSPSASATFVFATSTSTASRPAFVTI